MCGGRGVQRARLRRTLSGNAWTLVSFLISFFLFSVATSVVKSVVLRW